MGDWSPCGDDEPYTKPVCYHSDLGQKLGRDLAGKVVSFEKLKVTNTRPEKMEVNKKKL